MLQFCEDYTFPNNLEAKNFLKKFINEALETKIYEYITDIEGGSLELDCFFPITTKEYSTSQKLILFKGLYSLIHSDEEFIPSLIMEYILAKVLTKAIEEVDNMETISYIPACQDKYYNTPFTDKTRKKLVKSYVDTFNELTDNEDPEWAKEEAERVVDSMWRFTDEWHLFCLWDLDYQFLDEKSPAELRHSVLNQITGYRLMAPSCTDDMFFLPEDWEESKDFHFINQE